MRTQFLNLLHHFLTQQKYADNQHYSYCSASIVIKERTNFVTKMEIVCFFPVRFFCLKKMLKN